MNITQSPAWQSLESQREALPHLRDLFAADPDRASKFQIEAAGLFFDYSKNLITSETLANLVSLAKSAALRERIDAMFRGDKINITENRA
ncbi:MAG: glucose-6-phosphate isomerase, partial [Terrimicrobiaceae bacterium]